jgi:hypothetical protein
MKNTIGKKMSYREIFINHFGEPSIILGWSSATSVILFDYWNMVVAMLVSLVTAISTIIYHWQKVVKMKNEERRREEKHKQEMRQDEELHKKQLGDEA